MQMRMLVLSSEVPYVFSPVCTMFAAGPLEHVHVGSVRTRWAVFYPVSQHLGESWKLGRHGEREARPYYGGRPSGQIPQRGPGLCPWWGVGDEAPWSWKPCSFRARPIETAKLPHILSICKLITHTCRPRLLHIWCVSKNNYGNVWSSISVKCTVLSQSTKSIPYFN